MAPQTDAGPSDSVSVQPQATAPAQTAVSAEDRSWWDEYGPTAWWGNTFGGSSENNSVAEKQAAVVQT